MLKLIKSEDRGVTKTDWLDSKHSFSFGDYYDANNMGYRTLRVINEDIVEPGQGFGTHPHKNMEIITFVLSGALQHKDSLGSGSIIKPGTIQKMTAGRGITHSEFNSSQTEPVHLLQIWIIPNATNLPPSYEEADFTFENNMALLGSPKGDGGAVSVSQDVKLYAIGIENNSEKRIELNPNRYHWFQMAKGEADINGLKLKQGDALIVEQEQEINISSSSNAEILMFDLA